MEIGKSYLLSIEGNIRPYIVSNWQDDFIILDIWENGTVALFNIHSNIKLYVDKSLIEVIHENN